MRLEDWPRCCGRGTGGEGYLRTQRQGSEQGRDAVTLLLAEASRAPAAGLRL